MARRAVVSDIDKGFNNLMSEMQKMHTMSVVIGVQEGSITQSQSKNGRQQTAGIEIAQYAAQNEFGTDIIPQRSFMRTAFDENIRSIESLIRREYGLVVDGESTTERALSISGSYVQGLIQTKIRQITIPPNAPSTIEMKGSSKPLIDFGFMINAIRYALRKRGRR